MKKHEKSAAKKPSALTDREVRKIEIELCVSLERPKQSKRSPNQQFGVYTADGKHLGDIVAEGRLFTPEELRRKILFSSDN